MADLAVASPDLRQNHRDGGWRSPELGVYSRSPQTFADPGACSALVTCSLTTLGEVGELGEEQLRAHNQSPFLG